MQESQFVAAASSGFQAAGTVTSAQILVAPNYTSDRMGFRTAAALLACTLTNGGTSSTVWLQVIMILDGGAWKFKTFIPVPQDQLQVAAGGPYVVIEGSTVTIAAIPFNPNNETLAYAWDLDNDGSFETTGQQATFSAASINGPAERTVRVRATGGGGSSAVGQTIVTINAPPPTSVAITGAPAIGPEGTAISLGVTTCANVPGVAWTAQRDGATVATGSEQPSASRPPTTAPTQ